MSTSTSQFNVDALGTWTAEKEHEITAEQTIAYAKATNDENPRHLSGEVAPPLFAIVPPFSQLGEPTMAVVAPELLMRVLHGEQDIHFHQPIVPGMKLVTRAAPLGVHSAPSGVTLHTKVETRTADGEPVNDQWMVAFFRGADEQVDAGETAPSHRFEPDQLSADPVATVSQAYDEDQTYRYSEASGDMMPIHLDEDIAKSVGFPGIIIHGLCTMAFTSRAAVQELCDGETERLGRLAVRFSRPAFPGQTIETVIRKAVGQDGAYAFETTADDGTVVIKDGLAEVAG
jgi:acyl dehydratase